MATGFLRPTGLLLAAILGLAFTAVAAEPSSIQWWVSSTDLRHRLAGQPPLDWRPSPDGKRREAISVDPTIRHQTMLGLGSSLEPSTCWNLSLLPETERDRVMERLVDRRAGCGMNLMRICIGTPDFTGDPWYSYNDLPTEQSDLLLKRFSIERDRAYILPILKLARAKNPDLLFFASPWSPPAWMKDGGRLTGGALWVRHHPVYAEYFVRFIQAYEAEGIPIHAVTVQNEPGVDRAREKDPKWHYPSCRWTAEQERDFIRDHLGPAFRRHGLKTKIWCYDHNYNVKPTGADPGLDYPRTILNDPAAAAFVSGVAFHGYAGEPAGMATFLKQFPQVPLHFTEGSVFGIAEGLKLADILRNGASSYNAWVTMLDDHGQPNNGPFEASRTILTLNPETKTVTEHFDFLLYTHFMRFIQRGAVRIESTAGKNPVRSVAFRNPDGNLSLMVVNAGKKDLPLRIASPGRVAETVLGPLSVASFVWPE